MCHVGLENKIGWTKNTKIFARLSGFDEKGCVAYIR
jgi:hypothetical protein